MNKEFKITEAGFYRTREGHKAEVEFISKCLSVYPVFGVVGEASMLWQPNGRWSGFAESKWDLVAKWEEPAEQLYEWAFQHENGEWYIADNLRTERDAESRRVEFRHKAKRKLRRFPSEDCE